MQKSDISCQHTDSLNSFTFHKSWTRMFQVSMANRSRAWTTRVQLLAENGIFSLPPCPDWFWGPLNLINIVFWSCLSRNKEGGDWNQPTNHPDVVAEIMLIYNSLLHCISMPWSLPNHKANCIFYLLISSCRWNVWSVETALQMMCQHKSHCSRSS